MSFSVNFTFQGKAASLDDCSTTNTANDLYNKVRDAYSLAEETQLKLLLKGKRLSPEDESPVFKEVPKKVPKIMVMATSNVVVKEMAEKRSDPTMRGFDNETQQQQKQQQQQQKTLHWGEGMIQSKDFKFCRFQACTWQSFGHRPSESTPHAFQAMQLLDKLATDPGIVAIMKERELVVGTLGEMDPIDDRIMHKQQQQQEGACLLGYNTNGGARIDVKLRTDDLQDFRPYPELVATLIHELSHNWVGEHNLLFWTNHAQMRAEYLMTHARLRSTIVQGKTTAELAGLDAARLENVFQFIMFELQKEMGMHGLNPAMIEEPIRHRCQELLEQSHAGQRLGGNGGGASDTGGTARERALAAAERRAREKNDQEG
jgi:hypothetical protein